MTYVNRVKASIALLVLLGLASSFRLAHSALWEMRDQGLGHDPMTLFETRLAAIRHNLPSYGVVGYVTEPSPHITQELIWTRYYLAPLVVLPYGQHCEVASSLVGGCPNTAARPATAQLVIGNFHQAPRTQLLIDWHLTPIKDYGDGMMLFVNRER